MANYKQKLATEIDPNERELDVLRLMVLGMDQFSIARQLRISPETCKSRLKKLKSKLDAPNVPAAVYKAVKGHWLD